MLPKPPANYAQERLGIAAVQSLAAERAQIWRETGTGDVGIDGQLEFVNPEGFATGHTVAAQVKSGPSYFQQATAQGWNFFLDQKHRTYWERYPLPVLLVLHDPNSKISYWTDARQALRSPGSENAAFIEVPRANVLQTVKLERLFQNAGVQGEVFIPSIGDVLAALVERRSRNASFPVSYFDLFTQGLTSICRTLYFGMDMAITAAEANLEIINSEFGVGVGDSEHDFLFGYVRFLVAQISPKLTSPVASSTGLIATCNQGSWRP